MNSMPSCHSTAMVLGVFNAFRHGFDALALRGLDQTLHALLLQLIRR